MRGRKWQGGKGIKGKEMADRRGNGRERNTK